MDQHRRGIGDRLLESIVRWETPGNYVHHQRSSVRYRQMTERRGGTAFPIRQPTGHGVLDAPSSGRSGWTDIWRTFGPRLPEGIVRCETPDDYARYLRTAAPYSQAIRAAAAARFQ